MKNRSMDLCSGPLLKNIILYSLPIIATGVLQLLFNAADLIVVGRYAGSIAIAAVGSTTSLINLTVNVFLGISVGAGVLVAQGLGAKRHEEVGKVVHTALLFALVCGVVLSFIGIFLLDDCLILMGTPNEVLKLAATYIKIYFLGASSSLVYNFGASILRATGDTKGPLIYLTISGIINVVLNLIFVIFFSMDVAGVALATITSQTVSAVLVVRSLIHRTDACKLHIKRLRFHKTQLIKCLKIGIPAGIQSSLFSISNVLIQSSINSFGATVISGNAAASNIEGFVFMAMNSFNQTALNFTGQNIGARNLDRVKRALTYCLICASAVGIVLGFSSYVFGRQLLSIYITDSAAAIGYGMRRLGIIGLTYFLCGLMDTTTGAIRGMGSSFVPMIISIGGVCALRVGIILTIFKIEQFHTLETIYVSYPITWAITFIAEFVAYLIIFKKKRKILE